MGYLLEMGRRRWRRNKCVRVRCVRAFVGNVVWVVFLVFDCSLFVSGCVRCSRGLLNCTIRWALCKYIYSMGYGVLFTGNGLYDREYYTERRGDGI